MKIFCCFLFVSFVALCQAQASPRARLPWRYAEADSLTALWRRNNQCATYNVQLLDGYTVVALERFTGITNTNLTFTGLDRGKVYGARVQCVNSRGVRSPYGRPGRSKTIGTTTTTTVMTPTGTPKVGPCGEEFFTCERGSCVPVGDWCNRVKDCDDGSDERNCPGYCEEITEFHPHGNFSCSLFNSPQSSCFFDCDEDFERNGPWYTVCENGDWTRELPYCTLEAPRLILENVSPTSFRVLFTALSGATRYVINSLSRNGRDIEDVVFEYEQDSGIVESVISGLRRGGNYVITIAGIDSTDTEGAVSAEGRITL